MLSIGRGVILVTNEIGLHGQSLSICPAKATIAASCTTHNGWPRIEQQKQCHVSHITTKEQ
jgi:hypothetical protein